MLNQYIALLLFFALPKSKIDKAIIRGVLGYLISPLDIFQDFFPFFGFMDDIGFL